MGINDVFHVGVSGLSDGDEFVADGSSAETGAAEVFELGGDVDVKIYRETDVGGTGTYDVSTLIDAQSGPWHSQKNQIVVSQATNHRIRMVVSDAGVSGTGQLFATGLEVSDK